MGRQHIKSASGAMGRQHNKSASGAMGRLHIKSASGAIGRQQIKTGVTDAIKRMQFSTRTDRSLNYTLQAALLGVM